MQRQHGFRPVATRKARLSGGHVPMNSPRRRSSVSVAQSEHRRNAAPRRLLRYFDSRLKSKVLLPASTVSFRIVLLLYF